MDRKKVGLSEERVQVDSRDGQSADDLYTSVGIVSRNAQAESLCSGSDGRADAADPQQAQCLTPNSRQTGHALEVSVGIPGNRRAGKKTAGQSEQ